MDQDATWYEGRPRPRTHYVRWRPSSLTKKGHNFQPMIVSCGQTAEWDKMLLGTEVGLGPGDIVLDGNPAPPLKRAQQPHHFLAHVYCGQTAGWIKMPLLTEVGLGPGHVVLDGNPAPPLKRSTAPPHFRPMSIVVKRRPCQQLLNSFHSFFNMDHLEAVFSYCTLMFFSLTN